MRRAWLRLGWCVLLGLSALPAAAAAGEDPEPSQIRIENQVVTVYTFRGQSYRYAEPDGLGDAALAGQLVCLEGKLREIRGSEFSLHGTERKLQLGTGEVLKGFSPGDNLWVGGRAGAGGLTAQVAVKLKSDLALFDERFAAAAKEKSWEKMLDLAGWIGRAATYNSNITIDEHRRYRACRDRAVTEASAAAEAVFGDADAGGYSRLALRLLDLGIEREVAWRYFRKAAAIDPEQETASRKLSEAGLLRWHGQWLTREQKEEREGEELRRVARARELAAAREQRRAEEAASGAAVYSREAAEVESALAALPAADAATRLASTLERASSPRLGRRTIFLAAALPAKLQGAPLAAALRSGEPEVRAAALELAATRSDLAGRKLLAEAAAGDSSDEVVALACKLLATAGDEDALEKLVELVASDKDFRARAAVEALQKITAQDRWTAVEWRLWWKKNKSAYPTGPKE